MTRKHAILMIHNDYATISGEEVEFHNTAALLKSRGHPVDIFTRSSTELADHPWGNIKGFLAGVYNPFAIRSILDFIDLKKPDLIYVQNLYPLISPAVLPRIQERNIPIIMRVANYRLMCPNGLHFTRKEICERCLNGNEWWCVLRNCECNHLKSMAYAVRNWIARMCRYYQDNVTAFLCASDFLKQRLIDAGYNSQKIYVIPNIVKFPEGAVDKKNLIKGEYVGYVGRLSHEKGIDILLEVAQMCPEIEFRLAGSENRNHPLPSILPKNIHLVGFLHGQELEKFYRNAKIIVSTSRCFETFGMSIAEAMVRGKPVVVPKIGVFPNFVSDGHTGLLVEAGNPGSFAEAIRTLWFNENLRRKISYSALSCSSEAYSAETYYKSFAQMLHQLNI